MKREDSYNWGLSFTIFASFCAQFERSRDSVEATQFLTPQAPMNSPFLTVSVVIPVYRAELMDFYQQLSSAMAQITPIFKINFSSMDRPHYLVGETAALSESEKAASGPASASVQEDGIV